MKQLGTTTILAGLLWALGAAPASAREPAGLFPEIRGTFDPQAIAPLLEKATVVIIHEAPGQPTFLTGILLIHAPFEQVWSVVTDYERYHEFVPNVVRNRILERRPQERSQDTEYKTGFSAGPIELGIVWTLEQHLEKDERTIWSIPAKSGEQAFSAVRYREVYFPVDDHRTIMTYTNYADLGSFGALARLIFKTFPELETPTLVSVGTLFPESIKERVEGTRIAVEPKEIERDRVVLPPPVDASGALEGLLKKFGKVVLSWYPDAQGIRFFSSLAVVDAPAETCRKLIANIAEYPRIFKGVEHARKIRGDDRAYTAEFRVKYRVALPLTFTYSLDYKWEDGGRRLSYSLNRVREHTLEGEWGAWDFQGLDGKTLVAYTSFTDLRSGGLFIRLLMDNIAGFGTGFRVGLVSMVMQAFSSAASRPTPVGVAGMGF